MVTSSFSSRLSKYISYLPRLDIAAIAIFDVIYTINVYIMYTQFEADFFNHQTSLWLQYQVGLSFRAFLISGFTTLFVPLLYMACRVWSPTDKSVNHILPLRGLLVIPSHLVIMGLYERSTFLAQMTSLRPLIAATSIIFWVSEHIFPYGDPTAPSVESRSSSGPTLWMYKLLHSCRAFEHDFVTETKRENHEPNM